MDENRSLVRQSKFRQIRRIIVTVVIVAWFWYNPMRGLTGFSNHYLTDDPAWDLNHDGIVNMIDYSIMVSL